MKNLIITMIFFTAMISAQTNFPEINIEIEKGNFHKASLMIDSVIIKNNLSSLDIYELQFQQELMRRIKRDFSRNEEDLLTYLKKYYPDIESEDLRKWEEDKSLEVKIIDGERKYFRNAGPNLFRVNKNARIQKEKIDGPGQSSLKEFLKTHIPSVINEYNHTNEMVVHPIRKKLKYRITVKENVIPEGEIIRCWLPYPREGHKRQQNIKLISVNDENYIIADNKYPQRTLYLEKKTVKDEPTQFQMELEYTAYAQWFSIDENEVAEYKTDTDFYKYYTSEKLPHINFSEEIKKLSKEIIGDETNTLRKVKKIFNWISENIPWASALEYSTIPSLSAYCIDKMYGDCGIKAMTFITLARYNGIPAKWQSGWMLHPGNVNLHDWAEYYLEGYGWIPVDVDFGQQHSNNENVNYFYVSGIDAYRLIVNDDFSSHLFPAKVYPRSETIDFQRGELEWRGGNLYFDKWNYKMEVEYLTELEEEK